MQIRTITLIFAMALLLPASTQVTIEKLFQTMPEDLFWPDKNTRLELMAYYKEKKVDSVQNNLNGYCKIVNYDEAAKHLSVNTSRKGNMELQVFGGDTSPFVGVILTVCSAVCHSDVRFYTTEWNPVELTFPALSADDFLKTGLSEEDMNNGRRLLTPLLVKYAFAKGKGEITATCSTGLLSTDDKTLQPLLKEAPVTLIFENGAWKIKQ